MADSSELKRLLDSLFGCYEDVADIAKDMEKHLKELEAWEQTYLKEAREERDGE